MRPGLDEIHKYHEEKLMNLFEGRNVVHQAGPDQVAKIVDGDTPIVARQEVCKGCPWRKSNCGNFSPEAFEVSKDTCTPGSASLFMCHESGWEKPAICAGFILANGEHRSVKMLTEHGVIDYTKMSVPEPMYESYETMLRDNTKGG